MKSNTSLMRQILLVIADQQNKLGWIKRHMSKSFLFFVQYVLNADRLVFALKINLQIISTAETCKKKKS
jgi:hypothetical protein